MTAEQTGARRPGRARRYPPEQERTILLDAAMVVMRWNEWNDAPIAEILEESGLSTRSFYRHFASKDDILAALFRRDADAVVRRVRRLTSGAPNPLEAVRVWIAEVIAMGTDPRRADRAALLNSAGLRRTADFVAETQRASAMLQEPLIDALEQGRAEGLFQTTSPERDAKFIGAIATQAAGLQSGAPADPADASVDDVFAFCLRALGAPAPGQAREVTPTAPWLNRMWSGDRARFGDEPVVA